MPIEPPIRNRLKIQHTTTTGPVLTENRPQSYPHVVLRQLDQIKRTMPDKKHTPYMSFSFLLNRLLIRRSHKT